jgi:hypothetical protein
MTSSAHVDEVVRGKILEVHLHGKLGREDYEKFIPETERLIRQHGKISILVEMHDFHGWDGSALWEDLKWNAQHFKDIERLAIVGETTWHRWMTGFCKPFTNAEVRYFEPGELDEARAWVAASQALRAPGLPEMPADAEHLGILVLGYMWNHPLQQLNDLLARKHSDKMTPELLAAMSKLTAEEKAALKRAITSIFAEDVSQLFTTLDRTMERGQILRLADGEQPFRQHLPPWDDRFSYFDREGNPKMHN